MDDVPEFPPGLPLPEPGSLVNGKDYRTPVNLPAVQILEGVRRGIQDGNASSVAKLLHFAGTQNPNFTYDFQSWCKALKSAVVKKDKTLVQVGSEVNDMVHHLGMNIGDIGSLGEVNGIPLGVLEPSVTRNEKNTTTNLDVVVLLLEVVRLLFLK
jgi:hypothetical protein